MSFEQLEDFLPTFLLFLPTFPNFSPYYFLMSPYIDSEYLALMPLFRNPNFTLHLSLTNESATVALPDILAMQRVYDGPKSNFLVSCRTKGITCQGKPITDTTRRKPRSCQ
jgi:hypothetical protein